MKLLAIVNAKGVVHNWTNALCPVVKRVHDVEWRGGREIHKVVSAKQVLVFNLPGCSDCWADTVQFRKVVRAQ